VSVTVLVPPSEAKAPGGTTFTGVDTFANTLGNDRSRLRRHFVAEVARMSTSEQTRLLGVRGPLLERALSATRQLSREPLVLPAWQRYVGVVWAHLDAGTLSASQRRRLLIPSALYGLTRGDDEIADYRLKMNVSVSPFGRLDNYWREPISRALESVRGTIIDLLPSEHRRAVDASSLAARDRYVTVDFVSASGARAAGHAAKAVKGILARRVLCDGLAALDDFTWEGWRSEQKVGDWRIIAPE
jgi:cytoplasmic iron level regulating protein YaaA (DUF328/UPF0246 family)